MGKWIVTVSDDQDKRMQELAIQSSSDYVWINDWAGDAVSVEDMQKLSPAELAKLQGME